MTPTRRPRAQHTAHRIFAPLLALCTLTASITTQAATFTWDGAGADATWDDDTSCGLFCTRYRNWSGETRLPGSGDTVIFGSAFTSGSPDPNGSRVVGDLQVDTNQTLTILAATGDTVTLATGDLARTSTSTGRQVIGSRILLGNTADWAIDGTGELAVTGQIAGGHTLTKAGPGLLSLESSTPNTNFGTTTVAGGTLRLAKTSGTPALAGPLTIGINTSILRSKIVKQVNHENLPNNTDVTVHNDGWWDMVIGPILTTETIDALTGSGAITLGHLTVGANNGSATFVGTLEGTGTFTKTGGGMQILIGGIPNTHTGLTTVANGTLQISKASGTNAINGNLQVGDSSGPTGSAQLTQNTSNVLPDTTDVDVRPDGRWVISGTETIDALTGSGLVNLGNLTLGADNATSVFNGRFQGGGSLTKTGTGTFTITGSAPNTHTGTTTVANGTLQLAKSFGLNAIQGHLQVGDATGDPDTAILTQTTNENIPNTSNVQILSDGRWNTSFETINNLSGSGTVSINNLTVGAANGSSTFSGQLTGSGPFTKTGLGTLTLSGSAPNTNTNLTTVANGTLALDKPGVTPALGGPTRIGDNLGSARSAILTLHANQQLPDTQEVNLSNDGWWDMLDGTAHRTEIIDALTGSGAITLGHLTVGSANGSGSYAGTIEGTGTFTKTGFGTQTLTGSNHNTFTGLAWVQRGTLQLAKTSDRNAFGAHAKIGDGAGAPRSVTLKQLASHQIHNSASIQIKNDGRWDLSGKTETIQAIITDPAAAITLGNLTLQQGHSLGVIEGSGSFTKQSSSTLTLSGPSTYTGTTTIQDGTLILNNTSGSATGTSTLSIQPGATLKGNGSAAGPVTIHNGATIAPGSSTGTLTINNQLTLSPTSTLAIEVAPTDNDHLTITANVTLDGALAVTPLPDATTLDDTPLGTEYLILTYGTRTPDSMFQTITGTQFPTNTAFALAPLLNETTNEFTLRATIPGDLNLDNRVSVADLSTFALNFGTTPGLYNETLALNSWQLGDFNTDGEISVADLSLLALNFGFDATDPTSTALGLTTEDLKIFSALAGIILPAIPEPATAFALLITILPLYRRPRKQTG